MSQPVQEACEVTETVDAVSRTVSSRTVRVEQVNRRLRGGMRTSARSFRYDKGILACKERMLELGKRSFHEDLPELLSQLSAFFDETLTFFPELVPTPSSYQLPAEVRLYASHQVFQNALLRAETAFDIINPEGISDHELTRVSYHASVCSKAFHENKKFQEESLPIDPRLESFLERLTGLLTKLVVALVNVRVWVHSYLEATDEDSFSVEIRRELLQNVMKDEQETTQLQQGLIGFFATRANYIRTFCYKFSYEDFSHRVFEYDSRKAREIQVSIQALMYDSRVPLLPRSSYTALFDLFYKNYDKLVEAETRRSILVESDPS